MKLVAQDFGVGCGIAVVAALANLTYQQGRSLFTRPQRDHDAGFYCADLIAALSKVGLDYEWGSVTAKTKHILKKPQVIVCLAYTKKYPFGHYLVSDDKARWMDPWINYPKVGCPGAKAGWRRKLPSRAGWIIAPKAYF